MYPQFMTTRITDMPVYEKRDGQVDAALYNLWRRARLHGNLPLRIELPEQKQMVLIVEEDSWVVVDQNQYDLPMLAWVEFQDAGRDSLHTPVACTMNFYHYMASRLRQPALECLAEALEEKLTR